MAVTAETFSVEGIRVPDIQGHNFVPTGPDLVEDLLDMLVAVVDLLPPNGA